jgi:NADP-dependent 3-hydroxy acid dehydrogenase YdfG
MFDTEGLSMDGVVFDGDIPPADIPWFASEGGPAAPGDLGDAIAFVISRPEGFCINELVVRPTQQLNR